MGAYDNIVTSCIGPIFEVKRDEMLGKTTITHLVDLVQNKVEKIESRDQRRGEINVGGNREFGVVS
jgi:hypothetical protein